MPLNACCKRLPPVPRFISQFNASPPFLTSVPRRNASPPFLTSVPRRNASPSFLTSLTHLSTSPQYLTSVPHNRIAPQEEWTPLHSAASCGHYLVVCLLLAAGAQVNAANSGGQHAIHYASSKAGADTRPRFSSKYTLNSPSYPPTAPEYPLTTPNRPPYPTESAYVEAKSGRV
jgi:hypothetical protein